MREETFVIRLDSFERHLMVEALNTFRNGLIQDKRPTEDVDGLLLKVIDAPIKKRLRADYEAR